MLGLIITKSFFWLFLNLFFFFRYFKTFKPEKIYCGVKLWFMIHRLFMLSVPLISVASFIVIFADLDWKWVEKSEPVNFAHSIIGIIAIALSIVQVFIAFFRCAPNHPKRFVFNVFHRSIGLLTLVLSSKFLKLELFFLNQKLI